MYSVDGAMSGVGPGPWRSFLRLRRKNTNSATNAASIATPLIVPPTIAPVRSKPGPDAGAAVEDGEEVDEVDEVLVDEDVLVFEEEDVVVEELLEEEEEDEVVVVEEVEVGHELDVDLNDKEIRDLENDIEFVPVFGSIEVGVASDEADAVKGTETTANSNEVPGNEV